MKEKFRFTCVSIVIVVLMIGSIGLANNALIGDNHLKYYFNGKQQVTQSGEEGFIYNNRT